VGKEIKTVERAIAGFDEQKRTLNAQLLESSDATAALRLHNQIKGIEGQLAEAEER